MEYNPESNGNTPPEEPDHQPAERGPEPHILLEDVESFTGKRLEEYAEKFIADVEERMTRDSETWKRLENPIDAEKTYRERYNLDPNAPFHKAFQILAQKNIEEYRVNLREKMETLRGQVEHCQKLAKEKGWLVREMRVRVVIDDKLLNATGKLPSHTDGAFDPETGVVYVVRTIPNILLAHEVGHALSADLTGEKKEIGFSKISKSPEGLPEEEGNYWLNEGTTVLWQELSVNDESTAKDQTLMYGAFRDATLALIKKIGLDQEDLFRAYFGNKNARDILEQRIETTFGCSLHDLELVRSYSYADHTMEKIINGEHVSIEIESNTQQEIKDDISKLASLFPNVKIVQGGVS